MAHALRGAARMAGAAAFTDALQALERCLNGADPGRTNAALAACADALQQAHRAWWGLNSSSDPTGWRRIK
jgi:HPt (histidine-containing phosphotransfer) domain-containing protein